MVNATYTKVVPVEGNAVTFKSATDKGNGSTERGEWTVVKTGVTMHCTDGTVYDDNYRIYKDAVLTISCNETAGNIVKIEFDGYSSNAISNLTPATGVMTMNGNNGTWIGETNSVAFTASAQARASEIRVYVTGDVPEEIEIAAPTLPASQNFDESLSVEIINNEEGATLMYALNDGEFTEYTQALNITETTTVHAKAVKGEYESVVVSATYTKNEPVEAIMTLDEVNHLGNGTDFTYGGNAVVTAQQGAYLWVRDASGYGLIYGKINGEENLTFTNGQVLNPNWTATTTVYNGLPEYKNAMGVSASETTDTELAAPQEITELNENLVNAYVVVKNITSFTVDGRNITANLSDGTTMVMYNQFNTVITNIPTEEGNYTVTGAVGRYAKGETDQIQLYILNIEGAEPPVIVTYDVFSFEQAYALDPGSNIAMYNDAVVTYQNGNRLFVRDEAGTSGLIYGTLTNTFENGQVLSDGWTATYMLHNDNTPEFTNVKDEEITASGETRDAAPVVVTTISAANVNDYVILKGVTLVADTTDNAKFYTAEGIEICNFFNGVEIPAVEEGKTYDVTGIVILSKAGLARVYITELAEVEEPAGLRGDVDGNGVVAIADVTVLIDMLLKNQPAPANADCNLDSTISIADVTSLIDYLLKGNWPNN